MDANGFSRYQAHFMEEDYYQQHKPQGWVVYRNRAERIIEEKRSVEKNIGEPNA